jgi:hypothetical protein
MQEGHAIQSTFELILCLHDLESSMSWQSAIMPATPTGDSEFQFDPDPLVKETNDPGPTVLPSKLCAVCQRFEAELTLEVTKWQGVLDDKSLWGEASAWAREVMEEKTRRLRELPDPPEVIHRRWEFWSAQDESILVKKTIQHMNAAYSSSCRPSDGVTYAP